MRRGAAIIAAIFVFAWFAGCKRGEVSTTMQTQQPSAEEAALKDLLKYAQQTGQTLEELQQTLSEWQASQRAEEGPSSIEQDLSVLKRLLSQAQAAVGKKATKESLNLIARMSRVARGLLAELPGQQVAVRVERALSALGQETPDASAATKAILSAIDACLKAKDAPLVPNVVKELEAAKQAATSDAQKAREHLMSVLDACANDQAARWAYYIVKGLEGAFGAVGREAWPVAKAELEQVGLLIDKLSAAARGQKAQAAEQQPTQSDSSPQHPSATSEQQEPVQGQSPSAASTPEPAEKPAGRHSVQPSPSEQPPGLAEQPPEAQKQEE